MILIRDYSPQDAAQLERCIIELQSFEKTIEPNRADGQKIAPAYRELLLTRQPEPGKNLCCPGGWKCHCLYLRTVAGGC